MNEVIDVPSEIRTAEPNRERLMDTQQMVIEQRITNEKPSAAAAYLLCIFLGEFGIRRL